MKFIINTSLEPEFCALFNKDNVLIDIIHFPNRRKTGLLIWKFLEKYNISSQSLSFIGGITGPGSFSSLRTTAGILNVLNLKFGLPVHQARADLMVKALLKKERIPVDTFVLNSFGDSVFYPQNHQLIRASLDQVVEKFKQKTVCVSFLPKEKGLFFEKTMKVETSPLPQICLSVLEQQSPSVSFEADYEFPAV